MKEIPNPLGLVVCETTAAISTHFRLVSPEFPIRLGGHWPRPKTLCDKEAAWDTQLPIKPGARCGLCQQEARRLGWSPT